MAPKCSGKTAGFVALSGSRPDSGMIRANPAALRLQEGSGARLSLVDPAESSTREPVLKAPAPLRSRKFD